MGEDPSSIRQEIEDTRGQMGDTVEALAYKADVPGRVKESISSKRDRLVGVMSGTGSKISDATPSGGDLKQGAGQAVGIAQENPLGLAIGGLAVGFLVGLALPKTQIEDERIGRIADDVKEKVKETGQEALESGKQVAQDAASAASDAVSESGREQADELRSSAQDKVAEVQGSPGTPSQGSPSTAFQGSPSTP